MSKLSVYDATKEELIQYFFQPDCFGGGHRIPALKDKFLMWLKQKREKEYLDAMDTSAEDSHRHLTEYIRLIKLANDTSDIDEKFKIFDQANKAYQRYELAEKHYQALDKKLSDSFGF